MTEEQFIKKIYEATGKKLGEYGFISGTCHPFAKIGFTPANRIDGFEVWKKGVEKGLIVKCGLSQEEYIKIITKFLNGK